MELKVGTLDELMLVSDELLKLDAEAEAICRKIKAKFFELVGSADRTKRERDINVDGVKPRKYWEVFAWNAASYPSNKKLKEIQNIIQRRIKSANNSVCQLISSYQDAKGKLNTLSRKADGNLLVQDIDDIMRAKGFDAREYFKEQAGNWRERLLVVVQSSEAKAFEEKYCEIDKAASTPVITVFEKTTAAVAADVPMTGPLTTFVVRTENKRVLHVQIGVSGGASPTVKQIKSALAAQHGFQFSTLLLKVQDRALRDSETMADAGISGTMPIDMSFQDPSANTNRKGVAWLSPVVPGSLEFVAKDKDGYSMYSVWVMRGKDDQYIHSYKASCQKLRYTVREYTASKDTASKNVSMKTALKALEKKEQQKKQEILIKFPAHFQTVYIATAHIKAVRVFANAVLRFGVPPKFVSVVADYNGDRKLKRRAEKALQTMYAELDFLKIAKASNASDVLMSQAEQSLIPNKDQQKYYPFVYIPIDVMEGGQTA